MKKFYLLPLILSFALPFQAGDPLTNVLKHAIRGGAKESIKTDSKIRIPYQSSPSTNFFGKYGSSFEAFKACRDWEANNENYYRKKGFFDCRRDPETNQVIGLKGFKVKKKFKY